MKKKHKKLFTIFILLLMTAIIKWFADHRRPYYRSWEPLRNHTFDTPHTNQTDGRYIFCFYLVWCSSNIVTSIHLCLVVSSFAFFYWSRCWVLSTFLLNKRWKKLFFHYSDEAAKIPHERPRSIWTQVHSIRRSFSAFARQNCTISTFRHVNILFHLVLEVPTHSRFTSSQIQRKKTKKI